MRTSSFPFPPVLVLVASLVGLASCGAGGDSGSSSTPTSHGGMQGMSTDQMMAQCRQMQGMDHAQMQPDMQRMMQRCDAMMGPHGDGAAHGGNPPGDP